ncbi:MULTISPECIES: TIGR00266 family protein [unclassified Hahella]|uniref:TIGR00266 family protein n=1 Tax=unclassified Hahella TaxID=2624107 RepID=UPI001C1EFA6A|nr:MULTISPECIES: TIGR00266 family protein [unclassified Hahella]MBU6954853.1 TIGR00266 family protein [Hahella sp. HN01]MDG9669734.1 TIGR00266 family protein [Hahella sp. CR1]WLQ11696.1 TIGR00266 family protein [Hahella sp. HNIBRBA332]
MRSHEVDYKIIGHDMQMVEVELDPGETVIAEAGAMNYMTGGIEFETKMGDGSDPEQGFFSKLFSAGKRMMTGESLFMTHFTNSGHGKQQVSFAAPYPGSIVPVDLANQGGTIICQKDSFLAAAMGTRISVEFNRRLGSGFFGGEGFVLQKLEGDGMAFIHACGTVVEKRLDNETLRLDTGCLVAFTPSISYEIEMVKGIRSMFFGGEGMFLATLRGTGTVWIQSLPFSRLADRILAHAPKQNGGVEVGED